MRQRFGESVRKAIDASYISKSWFIIPNREDIKSISPPTLTWRSKTSSNTTRTRFQIEFCFRDSKQFTGLNDCQARDLRKLDFAFNASLASVNTAKVMRQRYYPSLSIGLLKAYLSNIYMLKRIFSKSGLKPNRTFNTKLIKELFGIVAEAA